MRTRYLWRLGGRICGVTSLSWDDSVITSMAWTHNDDLHGKWLKVGNKRGCICSRFESSAHMDTTA